MSALWAASLFPCVNTVSSPNPRVYMVVLLSLVSVHLSSHDGPSLCRTHLSRQTPFRSAHFILGTQMSQLAKLRLRGARSDGGHAQDDWVASMEDGQLKWYLVWQIESAGYEISKGRKHSQHIADQWKTWKSSGFFLGGQQSLGDGHLSSGTEETWTCR